MPRLSLLIMFCLLPIETIKAIFALCDKRLGSLCCRKIAIILISIVLMWHSWLRRDPLTRSFCKSAMSSTHAEVQIHFTVVRTIATFVFATARTMVSRDHFDHQTLTFATFGLSSSK